MNARKATEVMVPRRLGAMALSEPMRMPRELGLAKPQMANVAMPALRACVGWGDGKWATTVRDCRGKELFTYANLIVLDVLAQSLVGNELVDDGLGGHHLGNDVAVILGHTHCPGQWDEDLGEYPLEVDVVESHQEAQPADDAVEEGNECHKGHNVGNDA